MNTVRTSGEPAVPWQIQMFRKSLKKQQKVNLLLSLAGPLDGKRCLLVTNGDNNGAMNWHFRNAGGVWSWAELGGEPVAEIERLLGETVHPAQMDGLPFPDESFDCVVVIDAHEHLTDVAPLNREIARLVAPDGVAIVTTPNGNPRLPVAVLKRIVGMSPASYGHVVQGYGFEELEQMVRNVGLEPTRRGGYAKFFTELAELAINFGYVKVLSRRKGGPRVAAGTIAPTSQEQLRAVQKTYRMYSLIYPFVRAFSALDILIPGRGGYAVAIAARKPA